PLSGNLLQGTFGFAINHFWFRLASPTRQQLRRLQAVFDRLPQLEISGVWPPSRIENRQTRDLDNAAFNRIHQPKVTHQPWERAPFGMATAFDVKGGRRQINTPAYPWCTIAQCVIEPIQPVNPYGGFLHFGLEVGLFIAREALDVSIRGRTPAMMSFIVEHHNGHPVSKIAQHTPGKHRWRFWSLV